MERLGNELIKEISEEASSHLRRLRTPNVRLWHTSDAVIMRREGRITGLERTHLQWVPAVEAFAQ